MRDKTYACDGDKYGEHAEHLKFITKAPTQILWQPGDIRVLFNHGAPMDKFAEGMDMHKYARKVYKALDALEQKKTLRMWGDFCGDANGDCVKRRAWDTTVKPRNYDFVATPREILSSYGATKQTKVYSFSGHQDRIPVMFYSSAHIRRSLIIKTAFPYEDLTNFFTIDMMKKPQSVPLPYHVTNDQNENIGGVFIHSNATEYNTVTCTSVLRITVQKRDKTTLEVQWNKINKQHNKQHNITQSTDRIRENITQGIWQNPATFWELMKLYEHAVFKEQGFILTQPGNDLMYNLLLETKDRVTRLETLYKDDEETISTSLNELYFFGDLHGSANSIASLLLYLKKKHVISDNGVVNNGYGVISGGDLLDRGFYGEPCVFAFYYIYIQTRNANESTQSTGYCGITRGNHEDCKTTSDKTNGKYHMMGENSKRYDAMTPCCMPTPPPPKKDLCNIS